MKITIACILLAAASCTVVDAARERPAQRNVSHIELNDTTESRTQIDPNHVELNAYGHGVGMDIYGRAVRHDPLLELQENVYGPGIGMDQFGRPVTLQGGLLSVVR